MFSFPTTVKRPTSLSCPPEDCRAGDALCASTASLEKALWFDFSPSQEDMPICASRGSLHDPGNDCQLQNSSVTQLCLSRHSSMTQQRLLHVLGVAPTIHARSHRLSTGRETSSLITTPNLQDRPGGGQASSWTKQDSVHWVTVRSPAHDRLQEGFSNQPPSVEIWELLDK